MREGLWHIILTLAVGGAIVYPVVCHAFKESARRPSYESAWELAVQKYHHDSSTILVGLTDSEERQWHRDMGVEPGRKPTKEQLDKFISDRRAPTNASCFNYTR